MSNNIDIKMYDFENSCRTCLSTENLKPLYEKSSLSTCLADMLMSCTFVKITEGDGFPVKICLNCIHELKQAFLFAKRCETTDKILKRVKEFETEFEKNASICQTDKPIIIAEEEMKIIIPNDHRTMEEVLEDFEFVEANVKKEYVVEGKQEVDVKIKYEEYVGEIEQEEELIIKDEHDETHDDPANERDEEDVEKHEDHTYCLKREVSIGERLYACELCRRSYIHYGDLRRHKQKHTDEKQNVCSVCRKAFDHLSQLKFHMRIHTGKKPYVCEVCNKAFTQPTDVKRHMRIHTGEKRYSCRVCNKAFTFSCNLKQHWRLHTGEKPYSCEVCSKAFTQHSHLKDHMKSHTREKAYSCGVCNKTFIRSLNLKRHMKIHTGERPAKSAVKHIRTTNTSNVISSVKVLC